MSWIFGTCPGSVNAHLELSDAIVAAATGNSVATAAVSSGGTGYTVGDILSVAGGTGTVTAQIEVTSVAAGVIDGVRIYNAGVYTSNPSSPNSVTGGTGSSASITLTFASNGWTAEEDTTYSGSEKSVVLNGSGGGSDEIFVGWRTYSDAGSNYYNLELHGLTGYTSGLDMVDQPGVSPGFFDGSDDESKEGCYLLCRNTSVNYWLSVTPYRITGVVQVGTSYFNFYLGWGNRFATATEYPYPCVVAGHTSEWDASHAQSKLTSGLVDPWRESSGTAGEGPMAVFFTDGVWHSIANGLVSATTRTASGDRVVLPCGRTSGITDSSTPAEDKFAATYGGFQDIIPVTGLSGGNTAALMATPGTGDIRVLLPTVVQFWDPSDQIVLELDRVFWISAHGGIGNNDRYVVGSDYYHVFQNCNRTDIYAFLAIKED